MSDLNDLVRLIETMQMTAKANEQEEWQKYQADDTRFSIWFAQQQRLRAITDFLLDVRRVVYLLGVYDGLEQSWEAVFAQQDMDRGKTT